MSESIDRSQTTFTTEIDSFIVETATTGNLTDEARVTVSGTAGFTTSADNADIAPRRTGGDR